MDSDRLLRKIIGYVLLMVFAGVCFLPALDHKGWVAIPAGLFVLFAASLSSFVAAVLQLKRMPDRLVKMLDCENLTDLAGSDSPWAPAASTLVRKIETLVAQREQQHLLLRLIMENTADAVLCCGEDGRVTFANKAFLRLAGLPSLVYFKTLAGHNPRLAQMIASNDDSERYTESGGVGTVYYKITHTRFRMDDQWFLLSVVSDISAGIVRNESESWHRLLRILNHEIANTISPVSSLTSVLAQRYGDVNPELGEGLGVVARRIERMIEFAGRIRTFSKMPEPVMTRVVFSQLVEETLVLMQSRWPGIRFGLTMPGPIITIRGDAALLQQMLINLLQNSAEALTDTPGPTVTIGIEEGESSVKVRICDNGAGIDPAVAGDIFVPMFTTKQGGSGLGLSLSREIALKHSGMLELVQKDGPGTCFVLTISRGFGANE